MVTKSDISNLVFAKDLVRLKKETSYRQFDDGFFPSVPDMHGYIYKFKITDAKIVVIVNTSECKYDRNYCRNNGIHFLIYRASSLKAFIDDLFTNISDMIDLVNKILDNEQANADERAGGVPHGYKINQNGEIVPDPIEATTVRKIYKLYIQYGSIRKIASELKTNFSHVRDVLHDYRYEKMTPHIIPDATLKRVRSMMDSNRKNRTT